MKKIMLAIGHKQFEEALIKKLNERYTFAGIALYREAILVEATKHYPDIIIIREHLDGLSNMSDIIYSLRERVPSARIVFISTERHAGDEFLATLVSYGVYDLFIGTNIRLSSLIDLIEKPNTFGDVSLYAAKVTVDEKDGKRIFETKIIQAPTQEVPSPKANKPVQPKAVKLPVLANMPPTQKESMSVVDESIPVSFIEEISNAETPKENNQSRHNSKRLYDEKLYAPEDFLSRTSKPIKPHNKERGFEQEFVSIIELPPQTSQVSVEDDRFDFEIVDEDGMPIKEKEKFNRGASGQVKLEILEDSAKSLAYVDSQAGLASVHNQEPEQESAQIKRDVETKTHKAQTSIKKNEPTISHERLDNSPTVVKEEAKTLVQNEEAKSSEVRQKEDLTINQKKNKWFNQPSIPLAIRSSLFVRSEKYCENHTALNVAIKLHQDGKRVLFLELSERSSFESFSDKVSTIGNGFFVRKANQELKIREFFALIKEQAIEHIVIDSFIDDEWQDWLFPNAQRFFLLKQNKTWFESFMLNQPRLMLSIRFFVLVIEEYTEFGISPRTMMNESRALGVIKIQDKKENNFLAVSAKTPAMMIKKNEETAMVYRDLVNYVLGVEDEPHI